MTDARDERLAERAAAWREDNGVPGVVAGVLDDQRLAWSCALGWADVRSGAPMTTDRVFRIGSITKTFVAAAILQLRDEGRLALDDPLVRHLPAARAVRSPFGPIEHVTLRELLQHTAGMPREVPVRRLDDAIALTDADFRAQLGKLELVRPPRTAHQYSNVGYRLLGYAVEQLAGRGLADHVAAELLAPLGMAETAVAPDGELAPRMARGHWARGLDDRPAPHAPVDPRATGGEGALCSTLGDLARWLAQQLRTDAALRRGPGQVLDGPTLAESHRPVVVADAAWTTAWGLGWSTVRRGGCRFHGHNGSFAGFQAYAGFCPQHRHGAIVLTNGHTTARPAVELCDELLTLSRPDAVAPNAAPPAVGDAAWASLLGEYVWPQLGARVRVTMRGGRLVCCDANSAQELVAAEDEAGAFRLRTGPQTGERVRFLRSGDGAVVAVNVAGYTYRRLGLVTGDA